MGSTRNYAEGMAVILQIQNVPDEVHRKLEKQATLAGVSISEYALRELERSLANKATRQELLERLRSHGSVELRESVVDVLAAEREGR